ncbi:hypothetical protein D918_05948 [Trichuris suis]|nr:hypothetical protein D918_05948 [Trichuris suis]
MIQTKNHLMYLSERLYGLTYCSSLRRSGNNLRKENPRTDCTPPSYTKLLCTNLCGSTPAAVSDDLIKLYTSRVEK